MNKLDFIKRKLELMKKDKKVSSGKSGSIDNVFDLIEPVEDMAESSKEKNVLTLPADGRRFEISFDVVEKQDDKLVISAKRIKDGLYPTDFDPNEKAYIVEFHGTRAIYLRGNYKARHPGYGWSYISWDIRTYTNHNIDPSKRVYFQGFRADKELRKLIVAMQDHCGTKNILNSYIADNLQRFQTGIMQKKTPGQIEREWSKGMMESLGYKHVEAFDDGYPKGNWKGVQVHWCKNEEDLRGGKI